MSFQDRLGEGGTDYSPSAWRTTRESRQRTLERMWHLQKIFKDDLIVKRKWVGVEMNRNILAHSVYNYFIDLDRYKAFHATAHADAHKRAAFTVKWIVVCKPLQIIPSIKQRDSAHYPFFANEVFAIHAGLNHLDISYANLSKDFFLSLIYKLHFRPVIAETMISEMYAIEQAAKSGKV